VAPAQYSSQVISRSENPPARSRLFLVVALKTQAVNAIKRSDMVNFVLSVHTIVTFLFSVHTITEAKQYAGLDRAEPGPEPGRWIFQPGH